MKRIQLSFDRPMPRRRKEYLFGVFDEQAVSILAVLMGKAARFSELGKQARLSRASLFRTLKRLEGAELIEKDVARYKMTRRGECTLRLVLKMAEEESKKTLEAVGRRLNQMDAEYRRHHRIYHSDTKWERTAEKPLIEVVSMRHLTGVQSLLFQQRFLGEIAREKEKLRHSTPA